MFYLSPLPNSCTWPDGNVIGPIVAPAIYWSDRYVIIEQPQQGYIGGLSALIDADPWPSGGCRPYWHVEIYAIEKLLLTSETGPLFIEGTDPEISAAKLQLMQGARPSSQLKVRITWPSARGDIRAVIADIGTGIDTKIGPTPGKVRAQLLLPVVYPGLPIPTALAELSDESTATIITGRATPVTSQGSAFNLRYTQTLVVGSPAGGGDAVLHVIPACARWVNIYVAQAVLTDPPPAPAAAVNASFLFDTTATSGGLAPVGYAGAFGLAPVVSGQRLAIPQNAKLMAVSSAAEQLVTLVYELSL